MADNPRQSSSLFTPIDVSPAAPSGTRPAQESNDDVKGVLEQLVAGQDRQNELMEELIEQMGAAQRQRATELNQWKHANPRVARKCRQAAETLGRVQSAFLETVTDEIVENADHMMEGEFMLNEFVDRFGPRMAHLNGVLQVLSQLSAGAQDS